MYTKPVAAKEEKQSEKPQGFFTQNFYAEKEKSMQKETVAQASEETPEPIVVENIESDVADKVKAADSIETTAHKVTTDTDILGPSILEVLNKEKISTEESFFKESDPTDKETEATAEELPVRKQKPIIVATGGSGSGRGRSRKMSQPKKKSGFNADEMRNVWQSVSQENQKLKQRGRGYVIEEKPKRTDDKKFFTKPVSPETTSESKRQDLINQTIDEKAFSVTKPLSIVEETQTTAEEKSRERAGYEKVHVTIDGKEISYWKKV